jgi:hypothetical protein
MNFDKLYIKIINYLPFIKKRLNRIELSGKEFRFIGKNLEYLPAEILVGTEEFGYNTTTACYYPNEFLNKEWIKFSILKHKGILIRENKKGKWDYIRNEIFEYEKVNYNVMVQEMEHCIERMPKMFDLNSINKHNTPGFQKYIIKTEYPEDKYYKVPAFVEFDALQINDFAEWYIGDESRPTIGKRGDYLVVYNGNPIKFTEEEKAEMKWELVYDLLVDAMQMAVNNSLGCGEKYE